jgi:hypothetical protein
MTVRLLDHWSPPDGAGAPVACLATSFTFDADFFAQDCLARFLSLSTTTAEGDAISSLAALLEEEDRLAEAQVSVLVDRSSSVDKRNLRWDVLQVSVPGGLLHAKVSALIWERAARIVIGSPNLTAAGYRRQVELALAIDLDEECRVPRPFLEELVDELRGLAELVATAAGGARDRAIATVDLLRSRVSDLPLPAQSGRDLRLAVAPARPGLCPLERLSDVWRGPQPLRATIVSPFWDDGAPSPAVLAVQHLLKGRPANDRRTKLIVAVDPITGIVKAPPSLARQATTTVHSFEPIGTEMRLLHAKLLLLESNDWIAALIGSSNATEAGYGLHRHRGHHELNVWVGCPQGSATSKALQELAREGGMVSASSDEWSADADEDEPTTPALPLGFVACTLRAGQASAVCLDFDPPRLPVRWDVRTPGGDQLVDAVEWSAAGATSHLEVPLPSAVLPSYLIVYWEAPDGPERATWTANIDDRSALPPPTELANLPVSVLLAVLASTRPLPVALEYELRRRERMKGHDRTELDPLRRFDGSTLLLQRTRHVSLALWRLQERLARPAASLDVLRWRLNSAIGPTAIADGIVRAAGEGRALPGESQFMLAELALTIDAVRWDVSAEVSQRAIRQVVRDVLTAIEVRSRELGAASDPTLEAYVREAFQAVCR